MEEGIKHMRRMIDEKLYAKKKQEAWITPTLLNGATGTIQYRKNQLGNLEFNGDITVTSTELSAIILPIGYRPNNAVQIAAVTGANNFIVVSIGSNGNVYVSSAAVSCRANITVNI